MASDGPRIEANSRRDRDRRLARAAGQRDDRGGGRVARGDHALDVERQRARDRARAVERDRELPALEAGRVARRVRRWPRARPGRGRAAATTAARAARADRARMVGQGSRPWSGRSRPRTSVRTPCPTIAIPSPRPARPTPSAPTATRSAAAACCTARARSRSTPRPASSSRARSAIRPAAAWRTCGSSAQPPAPTCPTRSAWAIYVTDMGTFPEVNEAYGSFFGDGAARAQHDRRRRPAAGRRGRDRRHRRPAELAASADGHLARQRDRHRRGRRARPRTRSPTWPSARRCCRR